VTSSWFFIRQKKPFASDRHYVKFGMYICQKHNVRNNLHTSKTSMLH